MEIKDGEYQKPNLKEEENLQLQEGEYSENKYKREVVDVFAKKVQELGILEGEYNKPKFVPTISKKGKLTKPKRVLQEHEYRIAAAAKFVGYSDKEIAKKLKMGLTTLNKMMKSDTTLRNLIQDGKKFINELAVNGIYKHVIDGNLQASIFWVKNNMPEVFGDKAQLTIGGTMDRGQAIEELNKTLFGEEKPETK